MNAQPLNSADVASNDALVIAGKSYRSRLLTGTGKFRDFDETRRATEAAGAVVPEARELNSFLLSVAAEVDIVIDYLLSELQRQTEALGAGHAGRGLPQSVIEVPEPPKNGRLRILPAWLRRNKAAGKKEPAEDRLNTAA